MTERALPGTSYPIRYAGIIDASGPCAAIEQSFRQRQRYDAAPQTIAFHPGRWILDLRFGSLLEKRDGSWQPRSGTLYHPYRPGESAYVAEVNGILPRALERGRVAELGAEQGRWNVPLLGRWSGVYFHLLAETLTQIDLLEEAFGSAALRGIAPAEASTVQRIGIDDAARRGIAKATAPGRFAAIDGALLYSGLHRHAAINAAFAAMARRLRARYATGTATTDRPIYIARLAATARPLGNEAAVTALAESLGYEILDPGTLSFADQVRRFAAARVVVGPHGSGLSSAAFCEAGSLLLELRPLNRAGQSPTLEDSYRRIAAVGSLFYDCAIFPNPPDTEAWDVDLDRAARILERAAAWRVPAGEAA
ncbi:glycosyltransferase family 61 protein [Roseomonas sp. HJA6]|uniref:Glycosyltransferase family 61 protein n=1 Tax=Roseomonas alba TaxID=2846776 RepID=A0ABS7A5A0_9PROT|nr:glycosyltransferase family 61 protein [Neoroseomonas alba]MBW6396500.1 glycosyltransferase family 61 protein [Neoroseomonas alba]